MGAVSATKANAVKSIQNGFISGVSPDGIAGIFEVNDPDEVLVILERRGIYKVAIEAGVPIMCSWTFGTTQTFSASWGGKGSLLPELSRMFRTSLFVFWGRFGLPIPMRVPLTTVFGYPIPCKQMSEPKKDADPASRRAWDQEIERLQEEVLATYTNLFNKHKEAYGCKHKKLVFK
eukprot:TRINITY_DN19272_c0_g1_i5.p2 TRINITY_DN19272_c0_g1~~TRINITY_DN19272_c0_g1_i5.p2  ORF type:complete len:176 (-),score=40.77 TRINITY_DN19272_c0_g1_i5:258-785(-)